MSLTLRKVWKERNKVLRLLGGHFQNSGLNFLGAGLSNGNKKMGVCDTFEKGLPGLISHGSFVPPNVLLCPLIKLHINVT